MASCNNGYRNLLYERHCIQLHTCGLGLLFILTLTGGLVSQVPVSAGKVGVARVEKLNVMEVCRTMKAQSLKERLMFGKKTGRSAGMLITWSNWRRAWASGADTFPPTLLSGNATKPASARTCGSTFQLASSGLVAK